jgi:hypothetical protein
MEVLTVIVSALQLTAKGLLPPMSRNSKKPKKSISIGLAVLALVCVLPTHANAGKKVREKQVVYKRKNLSQGTYTGKAVPRYALQAKLTKRVVTCAYSQDEETIVTFDPVSDPLSSTTYPNWQNWSEDRVRSFGNSGG